MRENTVTAPARRVTLNMDIPVFDLGPGDAPDNGQNRDLFSMNTTAAAPGIMETPKGQLPDHMKVVGILIGQPPQIIIEDSLSNKTYFIEPGHPQDGVSIKSAGKDQIIVNYQGQDIAVPISRP